MPNKEKQANAKKHSKRSSRNAAPKPATQIFKPITRQMWLLLDEAHTLGLEYHQDGYALHYDVLIEMVSHQNYAEEYKSRLLAFLRQQFIVYDAAVKANAEVDELLLNGSLVIAA